MKRKFLYSFSLFTFNKNTLMRNFFSALPWCFACTSATASVQVSISWSDLHIAEISVYLTRKQFTLIRIHFYRLLINLIDSQRFNGRAKLNCSQTIFISFNARVVKSSRGNSCFAECSNLVHLLLLRCHEQEIFSSNIFSI